MSFRSYFTEVAAATFIIGCECKGRTKHCRTFPPVGGFTCSSLESCANSSFVSSLLNRESRRKVHCTVLRLAAFQRQVLDIKSPKLEVKCAGRNPSEAGSRCPSERWGVTCGVIGDTLCWFGAQDPALAAFLGCCTSHPALGASPAVCTGSTVCISKSALVLLLESVSWGLCHKVWWIKGAPEVTMLVFEPSSDYLFPLSWNYSLCLSWMNL